MIKQFDTVSEYEAATKSTQQSELAHIESTNEAYLNGVNVVTPQPKVGDAVFLDENNNVKYIDGDTVQQAYLPASWTHVGEVYERRGKLVGVLHKTGTSQKYLDVCQYGITAIASTTPAIQLRMSPDYAVNTQVDVTLTSAEINATSAAEISAAVAAKAAEVGDTKDWWAYLADAEGNKVEEGGTQIVIQCDTCVDYRFYNVSATGCTIAHITWGDMPASNVYWHGERGFYTNYWGVMNIARTKAWATGSGRVPTAQEPVGPRAGNDAPVKPSAFAESEYCANLRSTYESYEDYLKKCYMVVSPQKYGCFALPSGKELTIKYALKTAPTKGGGTKYKFPFLYYCYNTTYGVDGLDYGDWFAPGVLEGTDMMLDATVNAVAATQRKVGGTTVLDNSTARWFAQRYHVNTAWFFSGDSGILYNPNVYSGFRAQAVTLLELK